MGRKRKTFLIKLPEPVLFTYEIAFSAGEMVERMKVNASRIETDMETLKIYHGEELVGEFQNWLFYVKC